MATLIGGLSLFSMKNSQRANNLFAGFSKCVSWNDPDGQKDMLFNSPDIGGIFNDLLYHNNRHVFGTLEITPEWTKPKLSLLLFITKPPPWLYWNRSSSQHRQPCQLSNIITKFHNSWCFWPRTLEFWQVLPWLWSSWRGPQTNRSFKNFWAPAKLQFSWEFKAAPQCHPPQGNEVWLRSLWTTMILNKALFSGGGLDCRDTTLRFTWCFGDSHSILPNISTHFFILDICKMMPYLISEEAKSLW